MLNFEICTPTKVIFGRDSHLQTGEETRQYGRKALVVYGSDRVKKSGLLDTVFTSLEKAGVAHIPLGGVKPNPRLDLVYDGVKICKEQSVDVIVAVGGGSPIDTAKAIAAGAKYDGDVWDFYMGKAEIQSALPVGVVLTMSAAGSEGSMGAVITNEKTGIKQPLKHQLLRPAFSILNPELTATLPHYQTACGCADIMMHAMERYFTSVKNVELTDRMSEGLLVTMLTNSPRVLANLSDYNARAEIMWAATLAHNDLLGTGRIGDYATHLIAHEISAKFDVAHGATLTIICPAWMKYVYKNDIPLFAQFAVRVMGVEYNYENPEETALLGIEKLKAFFAGMGLPVSLGEVGIKESDIGGMVDKCMRFEAVGNFVKLYADDVTEIFKAAL